jgi:peptidoglycan hydrolase-like protein with peptidoglycan-binding domain
MYIMTRDFIITLLQISVFAVAVFVVAEPARAATIDELELKVRTLTEQLEVLTQQKNVDRGTTSPCTFNRVLTLGTQGEDVRCLQNYLSNIYFDSVYGATGYFGPITVRALTEWQKAHGVTPAKGYFGQLSQAKYSTLLNVSSEKREAEDQLQGFYRIKNGTVVYKDTKVIAGADPVTFEELDGGCDTLDNYAKDKNHVYRNDVVVPELDPKTVELHTCGVVIYLHDKSAVWWINGDASTWYEAEKMDVDVPSFSFLSSYYAKDKNVIYDLATRKEVTADVLHFTELIRGYAKDSQNVFYRKDVIPDADPDTFVVVGAPDEGSIPFAKDKNHVFLGSEVMKNGSVKLCAKEHLGKCGSKN